MRNQTNWGNDFWKVLRIWVGTMKISFVCNLHKGSLLHEGSILLSKHDTHYMVLSQAFCIYNLTIPHSRWHPLSAKQEHAGQICGLSSGYHCHYPEFFFFKVVHTCMFKNTVNYLHNIFGLINSKQQKKTPISKTSQLLYKKQVNK